MAVQDEIENIEDIVCNIKKLMETYFYTQTYINEHYSLKDHTHPIDTTLNNTSNNPVTNRAITNALNNKADNIEADETTTGLMTYDAFNKLAGIETEATRTIVSKEITSNNNNPVTSTAIYNALNNKADNTTANNNRNGLLTKELYTKLTGISDGATRVTIDTELDNSSTNPIENRIITNALNNKADKNTIATLNNNGLMSSDYVNILTNLQSSIESIQGQVDKNDVRIQLLRYRNGVFDGASGTKLEINRGQDSVYAQIDCDDPSFNKNGRTIILYVNNMMYERTTGTNGRTTSGKLIELSPGTYMMSAFMKGEDGKNMVVDHKIIIVS